MTKTENTPQTLNESIIAIRVELQSSKIKKSGKNSYAGFDYYELADFLPKLNELMLKYQINDCFTIEESYARLCLIKGDEKQEYKIPFQFFETPINIKKDSKTGEVREVKSMQDIQYLGALNTYYKRYLYLNAFGITDGEIIDSMDNSNLESKKKSVKKTETTEDINYKQLLMDKLKELKMDVSSYAKEHKLNASTPQEEAKKLYETLSKVELAGGSDAS